MLITISLAACPTTGNINNFLAGRTFPNPDSVSFQVNASQAVASQTYNYQFQSTFSQTPNIAFGTFLLTQLCKASPSTWLDPTPSPSSLHLSPPPELNLSLSIPKESGPPLKSISGLAVTQRSKSALSMLVCHISFSQPHDQQQM